MPRNGSGVYVLPTGNPVVPFTVITSQWANTTMTDLGAALTESIATTGVSTPSANLPMGGFRHTGVGVATAPTNYLAASQAQSAEVQNVTAVSNVGNAYSGTLPFNSGNSVANTLLQPIRFIPTADSTGACTLALNGGPAKAILTPLGTPTVVGSLRVGVPTSLLYNGSAWVQTGSGGAGVNSLTSSDPQMITISQPTPGNSLMTLQSNVANGTVKLTGNTKIPLALLSFDELQFVGLWDAFPGVLPPNGSETGQFYAITKAGTLLLYVTNGVGGWVQQNTAVTEGDYLLWNQDVVGYPVGYFWVPRNTVGVASNVVNVATPSFVATDLQSWINQADSTSGFLLANGTRPMTGNQVGNVWATVTGGIFGNNLKFDGGWQFVSGGGYGAGQVITGAEYQVVATGVASVAPNSVAAPINVLGLTTTYGVVYPTRFGVGGIPRASYAADFYGAGVRRINIGDTSGGSAIQIGLDASGSFISGVRQQVDGSNWPVAGVPMRIQGNGSDGVIRPYLTISNDGSIQVGGNSLNQAGAIISTYKYFGLINSAIVLLNLQTIGVNAGSDLSAGITMGNGQVARIVVVGGSITLPAAVKLPKGGAQWGTTFTIIGLFLADTTLFTTFTPYDS